MLSPDMRKYSQDLTNDRLKLLREVAQKKASERRWIVKGGVYTDTSFTQVVPGTEEEYGPFDSYKAAKLAWWQGTCVKVDICEHRLQIEEI